MGRLPDLAEAGFTRAQGHFGVLALDGERDMVRRRSKRKQVALACEGLCEAQRLEERIENVRGLGHRQGRNRDVHRHDADTATRVGAKKPTKAVMLNYAQAQTLKAQPATPRAAAIVCCSVSCSTTVCAWARWRSCKVAQGTLTFYRPKIDKMQTHQLTGDTEYLFTSFDERSDCAPHHTPLRRVSAWPKTNWATSALGPPPSTTAQNYVLNSVRLGITGGLL